MGYVYIQYGPYRVRLYSHIIQLINYTVHDIHCSLPAYRSTGHHPSLLFLYIPTTSAPIPNTYYPRLHPLKPLIHPIPIIPVYTHYLRAYYTQYLLPTLTPTTTTHTPHPYYSRIYPLLPRLHPLPTTHAYTHYL